MVSVDAASRSSAYLKKDCCKSSSLEAVEKLSQPKDSEGKIIGKKTVRVVFPV